MKIAAYLMLGLSTSVAFAGEISKTKCVPTYDVKTNTLILTNAIENEDQAVPSNCFDLAKNLSETEMGKNVSGISVDYRTP